MIKSVCFNKPVTGPGRLSRPSKVVCSAMPSPVGPHHKLIKTAGISVVGIALASGLQFAPPSMAAESSSIIDRILGAAQQSGDKFKESIEQRTETDLERIAQAPTTQDETVGQGGVFGYRVQDESGGASQANDQELSGRMTTYVPASDAERIPSPPPTGFEKK